MQVSASICRIVHACNNLLASTKWFRERPKPRDGSGGKIIITFRHLACSLVDRIATLFRFILQTCVMMEQLASSVVVKAVSRLGYCIDAYCTYNGRLSLVQEWNGLSAHQVRPSPKMEMDGHHSPAIWRASLATERTKMCKDYSCSSPCLLVGSTIWLKKTNSRIRGEIFGLARTGPTRVKLCDLIWSPAAWTSILASLRWNW